MEAQDRNSWFRLQETNRLSGGYIKTGIREEEKGLRRRCRQIPRETPAFISINYKKTDSFPTPAWGSQVV